MVFESDVVVCVVFDAPGRYWTETKDFFDTGVDVGEVWNVVKPWGAGVSDDTAEFIVCGGLGVRSGGEVEYEVVD